MRFNLLYLFWAIAFGVVFLIAQRLREQSGQQLFGIAETEGQLTKVEYPVFVQKCLIKVGQQVKKGDTLFVLFRTELDKRTTENLTELHQIEVERTTKNTILDKDIEVFNARQVAHISELQAQINVLRSEITIQNTLKQAIAEGTPPNNNVKEQEIKGLEESIKQVEVQRQEQKKLFDSQRLSTNSISAARVQQIQNELNFITKEKAKLIVYASCDGFVEQVFVTMNELVSSYQDLVKINPYQPNKVTGFIHESLNIPYRLGDTVTISSFIRPTVRYKAQLVGVSPKLVELPFRLRRNSEVKAWGREVYINVPFKNDFFIGEKILIQLKK
jgi:multidrug resistance efflux pump